MEAKERLNGEIDASVTTDDINEETDIATNMIVKENEATGKAFESDADDEYAAEMDGKYISHDSGEASMDSSAHAKIQPTTSRDLEVEGVHADLDNSNDEVVEDKTTASSNLPIPLCIVSAEDNPIICAVDKIEIPSYSNKLQSLSSRSPPATTSASILQEVLSNHGNVNTFSVNQGVPSTTGQSLEDMVTSSSNTSYHKTISTEKVQSSGDVYLLQQQLQQQQQHDDASRDNTAVPSGADGVSNNLPLHQNSKSKNHQDSVSDGSQIIPPIATFTQPSRADIPESPGGENTNGPGYYVDTTVTSSSSSDGMNGNGESIPSTPTEVIQHPAQPHDQHQQQLTAAINYQQQAAAAQQAAQLAANAAALQAAQAHEAMAAAVSQSQTDIMSHTSIPQSMSAMSLHHQTPSTMAMSCIANGVISSVTTMANSAYSDGTMGGVQHVPMMMQQHVSMDPTHSGLLHQQGVKGNKEMPPTPPGELRSSSADEKDHDDPEKKKASNPMNMQIPPNVTSNSGPAAIPVALMHFNGQNGPMHGSIPGPSVSPPGGQGMQQYIGHPGGHMMGGVERMPVPMLPEPQAMYHQMPVQEDEGEEEELSPTGAANGVIRPRGNSNKRRNNKKPVPVEDKDDKYFERRKRNNLAAKRSRDARKHREDTIAMRANYLERENAILRAQLATLREEANSLRQLLSQRTMTTMTVGPNGQHINTMQ